MYLTPKIGYHQYNDNSLGSRVDSGLAKLSHFHGPTSLTFWIFLGSHRYPIPTYKNSINVTPVSLTYLFWHKGDRISIARKYVRYYCRITDPERKTPRVSYSPKAWRVQKSWGFSSQGQYFFSLVDVWSTIGISSTCIFYVDSLSAENVIHT